MAISVDSFFLDPDAKGTLQAQIQQLQQHHSQQIQTATEYLML